LFFDIYKQFFIDPVSQRRSSVDNQSEKTTLSAKLRDISPSKVRFQGLPKSSDIKRAMKQNSGAIDMNYLLKFPIEIWVSSGEPFVKPTGLTNRIFNFFGKHFIYRC
jgi:hypothetical protein